MIDCQVLLNHLINALPTKMAGICQIDLLPQVNLQQAHLSSDDLIRQAINLQIDPVRFATELVSKIPKQSDYTLLAQQGYLNIFLHSLKTELLPVDSYPQNINIYLPDFKFISNFSAVWRLTAGALMQAQFASKQGCHVNFYLSDSLLGSNYQERVLALLLSAWQERRVVSDYPSFLTQQLATCNQGSTVWFTPDCLPREIYSSFYQKNFRAKANYIVCPSKLYLYGLSNSETDYFQCHHERLLQEMLIILSGSSNPEEIILEESGLATKANLLWYLKSLLGRVPELSVEPQLLKVEQLSPPEFELVFYSIWIQHYMRLAVIRGSVRDFIHISYRLCDLLNLYFNSPQIRARLYQNTLSFREQAIITVVRQALSAILTMF